MDLEALRSRLGARGQWQTRGGGSWLEDPNLDLSLMAVHLMGAGARLATITARPAPDGEYSLAYHWDVDGLLLTFVITTHGKTVPSIAGACPAADWSEREIHDYFAVDFAGRADTSPLMLRPGDRPGVFA